MQQRLSEQIAQGISTIASNFKAEIVAVNLIEKGIHPDRLLIVPLGLLKSGLKDVAAISEEQSKVDMHHYTYIHVNRPGLYDALPEGLFHGTAAIQEAKDQETVVKNIKKNRTEELKTRTFFAPFELMLNFYRVLAASYERNYDKEKDGPLLVAFQKRWPLFQLLNKKQALAFLHILPIIHTIKKRPGDIATCFSFLLKVPVKITYFFTRTPNSVTKEHRLEAGGKNLGVSTVLGEEFIDGMAHIKLTIGPIAQKDIPSFAAGTTNDSIIDELCHWLLHANYPITKELLADDGQANLDCSFLGVNTKI